VLPVYVEGLNFKSSNCNPNLKRITQSIVFLRFYGVSSFTFVGDRMCMTDVPVSKVSRG